MALSTAAVGSFTAEQLIRQQQHELEVLNSFLTGSHPMTTPTPSHAPNPNEVATPATTAARTPFLSKHDGHSPAVEFHDHDDSQHPPHELDYGDGHSHPHPHLSQRQPTNPTNPTMATTTDRDGERSFGQPLAPEVTE